MLIAIKYSARIYAAATTADGKIVVRANSSTALAETEKQAYEWLGGHGLRRGRIQKLLDAAVRGTGPMADPAHPNRHLAVLTRKRVAEADVAEDGEQDDQHDPVVAGPPR